MDGRRIAIVGSGVLGTAFGVILRWHGATIEAVAGRDPSRIAASAARIGCRPAESVEDAARSAPWVLIAVPDDVVPHIAERIASVWAEALPPEAAVLHCSGALGTHALKAVAAVGGATGVCHPLQSMMNLDAALEWLPRSCFGVSGHDHGLEAARQIAAHVSGSFVEVDDARRPLYHAGACVASNFLTVLLEAAGGLLMDGAGLTHHEALQALGPLIDGTLENIRRWGTKSALTGPVARGDVGTVTRHLTAMRERQVPERWFRTYRTLGDAALEVAESRGLAPEEADAVRHALRADEPAGGGPQQNDDQDECPRVTPR